MNRYEMLYVLKSEITDEAKDAVIAKFENLVVENGGVVESTEKWGTKKLAYPINYKNDGYFVLMTFAAPTTMVAELKRVAWIQDEVIRRMITKL